MSNLQNPTKKKLTIVAMCQIAICTALLCVASYIVFPLPFTPVVLSAQTLIICMNALILPPKYSVLVQVVYLLLGLFGLPVFSGGTSGPGKLFGPTGGYYFGYIIAVLLISLLKGKNENLIRYIIVSIFGSLVCIDGCGAISMAIYNKAGLLPTLVAAVFPFIPGDILKAVVASVLALAVNKALRRANLVPGDG